MSGFPPPDGGAVLTFDLMGIRRSQRNAYPLLFVDRITEAVPGRRARGIKNFTYNEWFFPAHFDDDPNVPGFIQVECLVQVFIMTFLSLDEYRGQKTSFAALDQVRFRRKIVPGDTLEVEATLESLKRGIAKGHAEGFVQGELAVGAAFVITLPQVLERFRPPAGPPVPPSP